MNQQTTLNLVKRIGVGLTFILFPLVFVFAFAVHPGLLSPHLLSPEELIVRARHNELLQFGHVLVTLNTALLIVAALHFMSLLKQRSSAWLGFVGAALAVLGAIMLAADKGALCLTMSALDKLPDKDFAAMVPGLLILFSKAGWMALLWGIVLLPIGFAVESVGLLRSSAFPRRRAVLFLIGVLLVGTPDGLEIVNLTASILMAVACVPYGVQLVAGRNAAVTA